MAARPRHWAGPCISPCRATASCCSPTVPVLLPEGGSMRYDVSVIGLYILDVLGRPVVAIPERGNVEFIEEIRLTGAGTAGGTVIDTAKLGLRSLAVGGVGDDEKADFVLAAMQKFGVDISVMQRLKGVPTSATILNVRPNGDRPALHVRGASDHFDVPPEAY